MLAPDQKAHKYDLESKTEMIVQQRVANDCKLAAKQELSIVCVLTVCHADNRSHIVLHWDNRKPRSHHFNTSFAWVYSLHYLWGGAYLCGFTPWKLL